MDVELKRLIHIDFHTLPNVYNFSEEYDANEFAQTLKKANVKYINLVASCNIGFCYFPTCVGERYPYLKGDRFGETLKACHQNGIGVSAYINVGLNHENGFLHADWLRVNSKGEKIYGDTTGNFFRLMCLNSKGYQNYIINLVKEILSKYDVDGFFFDGIKMVDCYCDECLLEMKEKGVDVKDKKAVLDFAYSKKLELCTRLKELIPDKQVVFMGMPFSSGLCSHIEVECLPSGCWGYDYFNQAGAYARNFDKQIVYMTGRFQDDWGDFGGIKAPASFEFDFYDAISSGFEISFGDHLHPAKNLNPALYRTIGKVYSKAKHYEKYTLNAKYLAEIAIFNDNDVFGLDDEKFIGAVRILNELKYSYNLINADSDFSKYKVIIFPDDIVFDDALKIKVDNYLKFGGKILLSGFSGLNQDRNEFYFDGDASFCGLDIGNFPYFEFEKGKGDLLKNTEWAIYNPAILLKNKKGKQLANYINPYNKRYYDGRHGYFYTPPDKLTEYSSAILLKNRAFIAFKVFTDYAKVGLIAHRELVKQILNSFIAEPLIVADKMPITSRLNLTKNDKYTLLHIRATYPEIKNGKGVIEEHNYIPNGKVVKVKGIFKKAFDVENKTLLPLEYEKGYTKIKLGEICGYKMISMSD